MLKLAMLIAGKDLRLILTRGGGIAQAMLLGLLLIFIFSLSRNTGQTTTPHEAATIFWLSSLFCQILIFNQLYALEETNSAREGLLLLDVPIQAIWLGKSLAALLLLLLAQIIFMPATIVFLGQQASGDFISGVAMLVGADIGICALGSLLGAAAQGQNSRESMLSIILLPMLAPLLLAGISVGSQTLGTAGDSSTQSWLGIVMAFDAIFIAAGLTLFGFIYRGDD